MGVGHAQAVDRVPFEVELDQHDRLAPHDPAIMARLDCDDLRSPVLDDTAVRVLDVDLSTDEEPDVSVHAEVGSDNGFHIDGPSEPRRVNHALDTSRAGTSDLEAHMPHFTKLGAFDRGEARRRFPGPCLNSLLPALRRGRGLPDSFSGGLLLCHVNLALERPMLTRFQSRDANGSGAS